MSIWLPTLEQILILHERLVLKTGGASGIRDIGLIQSALARADASFASVELYPGVLAKAAAICCGLTQNHGFVDDNKRIGVTAMLLILRRNGISLQYKQEELIALGLSLAQGKSDVAQVESWLNEHLFE